MLILAIESSTIKPTVCVADQARILAQINISPEGGPGKSLIPAIRDALKLAHQEIASIKLIAVSNGPGSFTGLRVAVTAAKTLAYAIGCELIAFSSLDVIAVQSQKYMDIISRENKCIAEKLLIVIDAQRQQFFAANYDFKTVKHTEPIASVGIIDQKTWLDNLPSDCVVTGPGLKKVKEQDFETIRHLAVPEAEWYPRAETLAAMAANTDRRDDLWSLKPVYYRPSYAEENRATSAPKTRPKT
jgi:tRNA threonylcarbamoyladenosine biosynthesis protein TsaB